jgi:hypothetical protein
LGQRIPVEKTFRSEGRAGTHDEIVNRKSSKSQNREVSLNRP